MKISGAFVKLLRNLFVAILLIGLSTSLWAAASAYFFQENVGILCNPSDDQATPGIWWMIQGGPKTCVNKDPIKWQVGDFTGFYPDGDLSASQRGVDGNWYGSQAFQFQGDTFGIELHSDSVLDSYGALDATVISYNYDTSYPIFPFADGHSKLVYDVQLQVPTAYTYGPAAAYVVGYFVLLDTTSNYQMYYGAAIFSTIGNNQEIVMLDNCPLCTGHPIVIGVAGIDGMFTSNPDGSSTPYQTQTWLGFKDFSFSISGTQLMTALQAIKAKYPAMGFLSDDPSKYLLTNVDLNPELAPLDASQWPFGSGVFARMGVSAKNFNPHLEP